MLRITIELERQGNEATRQEIGFGLIANDGSGSDDRGNYLANFYKMKERPLHFSQDGTTVRVTDFPRQKEDAWELLRRCLNKAREEEK